jgi:isopentenyl phosphate kinase
MLSLLRILAVLEIMDVMDRLIFLKLGGSLITDKTQAYTARLDKLADLAAQIAAALNADPGLSLVLGHGSGSFGHTAGKEYRTRDGIDRSSANPSISRKSEEARFWRGFSLVWFQAARLDHIVINALHTAGVQAVALAPVSAVMARQGKLTHWNLDPLRAALAARLVPVVYGDVIFDETLGGTILSTEDLFEALARELQPQQILLAGLESAVWADFPARKQRVEKLTPDTFGKIKSQIGLSHGVDVTGGMESKVKQMLALVSEYPNMSAQIFSGDEAGNIQKALTGENLGTTLTGI